jgi:tRNA pseudouridine38-40 synthase
MLYSALLAYEGTAYQGFQWQPQAPTIQGEMERALKEVTRQSVRLIGAGRTDAGVHATGQVITFDVAWLHEVADLHRALNAVLPPDIVVRKLESAPVGFHPRFDARSRTYRYTFLSQPLRDPLLRHVTYHVPDLLDVCAMNQAAQEFVGVHDFSAFGRPMDADGSTVRQVFSSRCCSEHMLRYTAACMVVHFDIEANSFLRRMVRRLAGALWSVGRGRCSVREVAEMVSADRDCRGAAPALPARGLCLCRVTYDWQWSWSDLGTRERCESA